MILPAARGRPKKVYTAEEEAERLERRRASGRERSRRYYARLRDEKAVEALARADHFTAVCSHDCGCRAEILKPVCGLCVQGLCDG